MALQARHHDKAKELLLDKVAELTSLLTKHKAKGVKPEALTFYEDLLKIMKYAFHYICELEERDHQVMLRSVINSYLMERNEQLEKQLAEIRTIQSLQAEGRMEEVIAQSDAYFARLLELREDIGSFADPKPRLKDAIQNQSTK